MKNILAFLLVGLVLMGCKETDSLHPFGPEDSTPPGALSGISQTAIPGGVVLKYTLPGDEDLSYVKAVYDVNGEERNARASQYNTSLTIEGFPDNRDYMVRLYTVDKSENHSQPLELKVSPGESPVKVMRESLTYEMDFGGFRLKYKNPSRNELSVYVLQEDSLSSKMRFYEARVVTQADGEYQVIGLPNKENRFAVLVRDKFGNTSDSLIFTGRPWREEYLDKKLFKYVPAPAVYDKDDWYAWSGRPENLWDDVVGEWNFAQTAATVPFPHYLCIDLGVTVPIGRIQFMQRLGLGNIFNNDCPREFEVYGAAELPAINPSDPLDGWEKLNETQFVVVRPSGRTPGEPPTTEDMEAAEKGIMFTIDKPFPHPEIRYIRFKFLNNFINREMVILGEFSFWAQWK